VYTSRDLILGDDPWRNAWNPYPHQIVRRLTEEERLDTLFRPVETTKPAG
jgi:hypothetical protein